MILYCPFNEHCACIYSLNRQERLYLHVCEYSAATTNGPCLAKNKPND